jgi:hypothetical protein
MRMQAPVAGGNTRSTIKNDKLLVVGNFQTGTRSKKESSSKASSKRISK